MSDTREGVERNLTAKEIEGLRCSLSAATWPRINQWEIDALCRMAQALDAAQADARDAAHYRALRQITAWPKANSAPRVIRFDSNGFAELLSMERLDSAMSTEREG